MNSLEKQDGTIPGGDMQHQCHNHSSYDAVVHEFDKFFLTDREPMKDPY